MPRQRVTDNIRRLQQKLTEADSLAAEQNRQIIARDSVLSKSDQEHTAIKIKIEYIQRQLDEANERQRNREEEISQLKKDAKERERAHKAAIDQLKSEANTVAQRNMRDAQEREKALRAELKTVLEENSQIRARLEAIESAGHSHQQHEQQSQQSHHEQPQESPITDFDLSEFDNN